MKRQRELLFGFPVAERQGYLCYGFTASQTNW